MHTDIIHTSIYISTLIDYTRDGVISVDKRLEIALIL